MVERGQVLERMTLVQCGDTVLEGLTQSGAGSEPASPVVLASPHPALGGSMDSAVLAEIVWCLARCGHPTLRFNWRGVGASSGVARADVAEAAADLERAVEQAGARALVGYSFGASVAALVGARHPDIERVVLVAPVIDRFPVDFEALASSGARVTVVAGAEDTLAPPGRLAAAARQAGLWVQTIPGAGHAFTAGLAALGRLVADSAG